eukprot:scaffold1340_cov122-Cylindrotheca_fusiformis.AAC.8
MRERTGCVDWHRVQVQARSSSQIDQIRHHQERTCNSKRKMRDRFSLQEVEACIAAFAVGSDGLQANKRRLELRSVAPRGLNKRKADQRIMEGNR